MLERTSGQHTSLLLVADGQASYSWSDSLEERAVELLADLFRRELGAIGERRRVGRETHAGIPVAARIGQVHAVDDLNLCSCTRVQRVRLTITRVRRSIDVRDPDRVVPAFRQPVRPGNERILRARVRFDLVVDEGLARGGESPEWVGSVQRELHVPSVREAATERQHAALRHLHDREPVGGVRIGIQVRVLVGLGVRQHDAVVAPARPEPQPVVTVQLVGPEDRLQRFAAEADGGSRVHGCLA